MHYEFTCKTGGERTDKFLALQDTGITRSAAAALIEQGCCLVNGRNAAKNQKLKVGDVVTLDVPEAQPADILPENIPLDIVYEDSDLLVVNKPKGMLLAQVEPKCNLVPLMMEHFTDRFPNENFIIYDNNRRLAAVHEKYKSCVLVEGQELDIPDRQSDYFTELWKQYFHTMEIKPRHNERCQNTLMPKWYRKHMPEIQN